jgi:hypothetical protein
MEHSAKLMEEFRAYEARKAYVFDLEREPQGGGDVLCRVFASEVEPPPDHWPLLAGEAIQNFRAALDHSIWAAWRSVASNLGDGSHTAFPITQTPEKFADNAWRFEGVPPAVRLCVERWQPYAGIWAATPQVDPLAILNRLSNVDKHRSLTTVAGAVSEAAIGHSGGQGTITDWDHGTFNPLGSGRIQVASFVARGDAQQNEPDVTIMYGYELRIENIPLGYLWNVVRPIFEVLWEIETGAPPGPGAPYPGLIDWQVVRLDP